MALTSAAHATRCRQITIHEIADGAARNSICGRVMLIIADSIHTNTALSLSAVSARLFDESHVMALSHINGNLTSLGLPTKFTPSTFCRRDSALLCSLPFRILKLVLPHGVTIFVVVVVVVVVCSVGHILVLCFPPQRQGIRKNRSRRFFKIRICTSEALFLGPPCPLGEEEDMIDRWAGRCISK